MNKRGISLSLETVVVAALVLIVLFVVGAIFISQSNKYADKYSETAEQASEQAKGCNMLFGRTCAASCGSEETVPGKFSECVSDDNKEGKCCQKRST